MAADVSTSANQVENKRSQRPYLGWAFVCGLFLFFFTHTPFFFGLVCFVFIVVVWVLGFLLRLNQKFLRGVPILQSKLKPAICSQDRPLAQK